ncbi:hypothetical protein CXG81DRAFT_17002 [Caulochytrium protostelioides]|uniref:Uncharacterized protein n=1 Tax=Caulochytrium protostelioides TaxID=1555241 RepID=A0A4P9XDF9_9FUNG|nr:hypothetical protein CXG81DRAFT_17002 [Caulochytrium protostelioides]|eukprot:RKP03498.1 hypothetical protein CXG81DRAFT_17002 [Caulochytrium protostelioides]
MADGDADGAAAARDLEALHATLLATGDLPVSPTAVLRSATAPTPLTPTTAAATAAASGRGLRGLLGSIGLAFAPANPAAAATTTTTIITTRRDATGALDASRVDVRALPTALGPPGRRGVTLLNDARLPLPVVTALLTQLPSHLRHVAAINPTWQRRVRDYVDSRTAQYGRRLEDTATWGVPRPHPRELLPQRRPHDPPTAPPPGWCPEVLAAVLDRYYSPYLPVFGVDDVGPSRPPEGSISLEDAQALAKTLVGVVCTTYVTHDGWRAVRILLKWMRTRLSPTTLNTLCSPEFSSHFELLPLPWYHHELYVMLKHSARHGHLIHFQCWEIESASCEVLAFDAARFGQVRVLARLSYGHESFQIGFRHGDRNMEARTRFDGLQQGFREWVGRRCTGALNPVMDTHARSLHDVSLFLSRQYHDYFNDAQRKGLRAMNLHLTADGY